MLKPKQSCDIIKRNVEEECAQEGEADDHDDVLDVGGHGFAAYFFPDEHEELAAVDDGQGQEVDDGEVDGDESEEEDEVGDALLGDACAFVGDADGAAHVVDFDAAVDEAGECDVGLKHVEVSFFDADGDGR